MNDSRTLVVVGATAALMATSIAASGGAVMIGDDIMRDQHPGARQRIPDYARKGGGSIAAQPHEHSREIARRQRQAARAAKKAEDALRARERAFYESPAGKGYAQMGGVSGCSFGGPA